MACQSDGSGSYVAYTVTQDNQCTTTGNAAAQSLIRIIAAPPLVQPPVLTSLLKFRSGDNWNFEVDQFEAPNAEAGPGRLMQMNFGTIVKHDEINVNFEWPWGQDFNLGLLVGTKGTLQTVGSDLSYYQAQAKCVRAPGQPNRVVGDESIGVATWRWTGYLTDGTTLATPAGMYTDPTTATT